MFNLLERKASIPGAGSPEFNQSIKYQLHSMGDDGTASRHVVHYCYPEEEIGPAEPDAIPALADIYGLSVSPAVGAGGFVFEHEREVASSMFDQFTVDFAALLRESGYDYDGWECALFQG